MEKKPKKPLLVGFISDLEVIEKIDRAALASELETKWIDLTEIIPEGETYYPSRQFAEHITGPVAKLIDIVTRLRPGLMIFDLDHPSIPWKHWLSILKSVPATRRYPVLCFGSMINQEGFEVAKRTGADVVLQRELFLTEITLFLNEWVLVPDILALQKSCNIPLSKLAKRGIELFNHQEFFEAHEVLEEAWKEDQSQGRELYRAILQVAVAYLQIERMNYAGAIKMFWRVRQWIEPLPGMCRSVDVDQLREDSERVYEALIQLGPERIGEFDRSLFTAIRLVAR